MRRVLFLLCAVATLAPLLLEQAAICPSASAAAEQKDVGDLPLVEIPGPRSDPTLVLFLSGDGGWRDLDKTIGERLASEGLQVVGSIACGISGMSVPPLTSRAISRAFSIITTRSGVHSASSWPAIRLERMRCLPPWREWIRFCGKTS